jgi:hypothetical protein
MLIKYLLNKRYRKDYSGDLAIRIKKYDEQVEKIYFNIGSEFLKSNSTKAKKVS